jgi:hypothetical protein
VAALGVVEPLEQRVFLSVGAPPAFMIGVWQQREAAMPTWKARHVNTYFEMPECHPNGTTMDQWTASANANDLWVVRPPKRKAPYNSTTFAGAHSFENTCKDSTPGVTPAIEHRTNGVPSVGNPTSATWVAPGNVWDPAADVAMHPNILGFLQMDEPNGKYTNWYRDTGSDNPDRWAAENGFKSLQTPPGWTGTYPTNPDGTPKAGPSTGIPFYREDYVEWMADLYDAWSPHKPVFLTLQGDKMTNTEYALFDFYNRLGQDTNEDGKLDRVRVADAVGEDFYPINFRGGPGTKNPGDEHFPYHLYDAEDNGNPIRDAAGNHLSVGDQWVDLKYEGPAWAGRMAINKTQVNPPQATTGNKFEAIRRGSPGVLHNNLRWEGYDHPTSAPKSFDEERNFAVVEIYHQSELGLPGRKPTLGEIKGQIWDSILRGANGIVYFAGAGGDNTNNLERAVPGVSDELTRQNIRIETFADALMSGVRENVGGSKVQSKKDPVTNNVLYPTLRGAWRQHDNEQYFLVQNMSNTALNGSNPARFKLDGVAANTTIDVDRNGVHGTITVGSDGYITDNFGGFDTFIYYTGEITPPDEDDEDPLPPDGSGKKIEAESYVLPNTSVTQVTPEPGRTAVDEINNDDFMRYDAVNFNDATYKNFVINAGVDDSRDGLGRVEVWLDSRSTAGGGTKIGEVNFTSTGDFFTFQEKQVALTTIPTGTRNLFLLFKGSVNRLAVMDYFKFTTGSGRSATSPIEAESRDGTNMTTITGNTVDDIGNDDFLHFKAVDFGAGDLDKLHATLAVDAGHAGGTMEIWVDARSTAGGGTQIGVLPISSTGSYTTFQEQVTALTNTSISSTHDLYLLFKGSNSRLAILDYVKFTRDSFTGGGSNIQAESFTQPSTSVTVVGTPPNQQVDDITNDDFLRYDGINFNNTSFTKFVARVAVDPSRHLNGHIEVWLDARSTAGGGTKIGDLNVSSTGAWTTFAEQQVNLTSTPTGTRNVYLLFKGTVNRLMILDYFRFE